MLRKVAKVECDIRAARRFLAIGNAPDGMSRAEAACAAGMDRQALRDWVIRYNEHGLEAMQLLFDRFAATLRPDEHAVMVLGQAKWHGSGDLVAPANVTLVPLPPARPS